MSEQIRTLLHERLRAKVQERLDGKTLLYSLGFIFGFRLRQKLHTMNESELEVYASHLRNVAAARDGDRLEEVIARLCRMYVLKELKNANRQLAKLQKERRDTPQHCQ